MATLKRKQSCVLKMCHTATATAVIPWVILGDLNVDAGTMKKWCQPFVKQSVPCMSTSQWPVSNGAQKADHAISQGIDLMKVQSWVGKHSEPCASDIHDAVVVMGELNQKQIVHDVDKETCSSWWAPLASFFSAQ